MAEYSDVRRESVLKAMAEYDALGEDGFFDRYAKYGYGRATRYVVVHDGKEYDSKAILLAAHSHEYPDREPLDHDAFTGGLTTVVPHLRELDFTVRDLETGELLMTDSGRSTDHRSSRQVFLQPASGAEAQANYRKTIENPVPLARIRPHVSEEVFGQLQEICPDGEIRVWAATDGRNRHRVAEMRSGDLVLFYMDGRFPTVGDILSTEMDNPSLGRELWGEKSPGKTWPHIFFLTAPRPLDLRYADFHAVAQYGPDDVVLGLARLPQDKADQVLAAFDLTDLESVDATEREAVEAVEEVEEAREARGRGQGYVSSAKLRRAIEMHAMNECIRYFENRDYRVEDVSARKSYDLRCTLGGEVLCVEVKGTQSSGTSVILTANEVELAKAKEVQSVLFLVHSVSVNLDPEVSVSGGSKKVYWPWMLEEGVLNPMVYRYLVP